MSTDMNWDVASNSLAQTESLGAAIGKNLKGGETIQLISDLGGGKTSLVRGLAAGMGSLDAVASPSFTISREYATVDLVMHHYDFYRLSDAGIMRHELTEFMAGSHAVVVIEWADIVADLLPEAHITITIMATSETSRQFSISCPKQLAYCMNGVNS